MPERMKLPSVLFVSTAIVAIIIGVALVATRVNEAYADERSDRTTTELKLAAGQKLVDVSWRCFGDYPCRPFTLTRPMRKDETAETYALSSPYGDATDAYVIKESR